MVCFTFALDCHYQYTIWRRVYSLIYVILQWDIFFLPMKKRAWVSNREVVWIKFSNLYLFTTSTTFLLFYNLYLIWIMIDTTFGLPTYIWAMIVLDPEFVSMVLDCHWHGFIWGYESPLRGLAFSCVMEILLSLFFFFLFLEFDHSFMDFCTDVHQWNNFVCLLFF